MFLKLSAEKIFLILIQAILVIVPTIFSSSFFFPATSPKTYALSGLVAISFGFWIYLLFTRTEYRPNKVVFLSLAPPALFLLWLTVSGILGVDPFKSFWSTFQRGTGLITGFYLLAYSFMVASAIQVRGVSFLRQLLMWSVIAGVIVTASIWFDIIPEDISQSGGFIGNTSFAAGYMVFNIFFAILLIFDRGLKKNYKWLLALALVFMATSPLFINFSGIFGAGLPVGSSRGATLGVLLGAMFGVLIWLALSRKRILKGLGIVGVVALFLAIFWSWSALNTLGTILHEEFIEHATETRFIIWNISGEALSERPVFGYGPENFSYVYHQYFDPSILQYEGFFDRAHNIFWDTALAGGKPAVVLYIGVLVGLLYVLFLTYRKGVFSREQLAVLYGLVLAYVVQNLFVFDTVSSLLMWNFLFGISAGGLALFLSHNDGNQGRLVGKDSYKYVLGIVLIILVLLAIFYSTFLPARKAVLLLSFFNEPFVQRSDIYLKLLEGSRVGDDYEVGNIAAETYLALKPGVVEIYQNPEHRAVGFRALIDYLDYLEQISTENPNDFRLFWSMVSLSNMALFLAEDEEKEVLLEKAEKWGRRALAISSSDPRIYHQLGDVLFQKREIDEARKLFIKSVDLEPRLDFSHEILMSFAQSIGDSELYESALARAELYLSEAEFTELLERIEN